MSLEIWKDVPSYEGKYQVSSWGNIRNASTGKILHPKKTEDGYLLVDLYDGKGNGKHTKVHRLVASAFIPNKENKPEINHKDGNPLNNSITNLEWCTRKENCLHAVKMRKKSI